MVLIVSVQSLSQLGIRNYVLKTQLLSFTTIALITMQVYKYNIFLPNLHNILVGCNISVQYEKALLFLENGCRRLVGTCPDCQWRHTYASRYHLFGLFGSVSFLNLPLFPRVFSVMLIQGFVFPSDLFLIAVIFFMRNFNVVLWHFYLMDVTPRSWCKTF